jgi:2-dehydro-3-deoxy-D-arabinonate dehydratase
VRVGVSATRTGLIASIGDEHRRLGSLASIDELLTSREPVAIAAEWFASGEPAAPPEGAELIAPIDTQEVWAAGVTYLRSKVARVAESKQAGGDTFYDLVYDAERPELFLKATPHRVVGPGAAVRIRRDSTWNVPEPELTLVIASTGRIVGYTIGNDMSSRSIEGENPLYLPQAKVYTACAALGPRLVISDEPPAADTAIAIEIERDGSAVFSGTTTVAQIKRRFEELVEYLFRDNAFPHGVFLMTGTGIVPDDDFTLMPGDTISITIDGVGTLVNHAAVGD